MRVNNLYSRSQTGCKEEALPFFEDITFPVATTNEATDIPFNYEDFAEMSMEAVYIIDFQRQCYHYVSEHDFFLCGHSPKSVKKMGYDFYSKVVHPEDMMLWAKMHNTILKCLTDPDSPKNEINYFSCTFRLINPSKTKSKPDYLMAYQKLKPVWSNGQLQFGICLLSCSVIHDSGHLRIHYKNNPACDEFSFKQRKWCRQKKVSLTDRQRDILIFAKQGKSNKDIADILCVSEKTIRNIEMMLYQKLGVNSMLEAVIFATNHQLIFPKRIYRMETKNKNEMISSRKTRHLLTEDILLRIQQGLNNRQSVNSIAKKEGISEGAIRYAIKNGRLHQSSEKNS
ncbi:MAG: LuxR C-terminal-related transcriptional regulator [Tannerella sp.]|jgi:DNA-binding CsgD family transcriptional regulator|nr:LuxR C-terminal-related transcriptional regulator [Tannerella sp.]